MKEIKIKSNESNLKIFINDFPNFALMSEDELELFVAGIEIQMNEFFKHKRKKHHKKNKM